VAGVDDYAVVDDVVDCAAIYAVAGLTYGASAADA